jgi:hypothetical protein
MNKDRRVKRTMSIVEIAPTLETKSLKGSGETAEVLGKEGRILRKEVRADIERERKRRKKGEKGYHNPNFLTRNWWKILLLGGVGVGGYVAYNKVLRPIVGTAQAVEGIAGIPLQAMSGLQNFLGSIMQGISPDAFDISQLFAFPKATEQGKFLGLDVLTKGLSEGFKDLKGMFPDVALVQKAAANLKIDTSKFAFPVQDLLKNLDTLKQPFKITFPTPPKISNIIKPRGRSAQASEVVSGITNFFKSDKKETGKSLFNFDKINLTNFLKP